MQNTKGSLTHSRMACFRDCPRKHYLRYELGLTAEKEGLALRIGSAFHLAMEKHDKDGGAWEDDLGLEDPFDRALVMGMFQGHLDRYESDEDQMEVVATELEFDIALINPETTRPSTVWRFRGKIDRVVRLADGRLALQEYKTTTRDFSPGAEYWQKLHMDQQLSIYVIAARELGYDVQTVLYDVTRRPMLKPLKATPEDKRKYIQKTGELYANQRAEDEDPGEYAIRVSAAIDADPEKHFSRIEIARLDQDLDDCRGEIWSQQLVIRECQRSGRWWKNPGACYGIFPCDYLPICLNRDLESNTPIGFVRLENVHPELGDATDGG